MRRNCESDSQNLSNEMNDWTIQKQIKLNESKCKEFIVNFTKYKQHFLSFENGRFG